MEQGRVDEGETLNSALAVTEFVAGAVGRVAERERHRPAVCGELDGPPTLRGPNERATDGPGVAGQLAVAGTAKIKSGVLPSELSWIVWVLPSASVMVTVPEAGPTTEGMVSI